MVQKEGPIRDLEILPLKSEVKPQMSPLGRDGEAGDGRDSISSVEMVQERSLSPRCPSPANIGDEQKSILALPPFGRPAAIEKRNLQRNLLVEPPPTRLCSSQAIGSLVGVASPLETLHFEFLNLLNSEVMSYGK
jgi:hypothetical protein